MPESRSRPGSLAEQFPPSLVKALAVSLSTEAIAESAVPSYTHWNPAIRWLMFRRLEVIREMASTVLHERVERGNLAALDFGCGIGVMIPALASSVATLFVCDEQLAPARATAERFAADNVVFVPPEEIRSRIAAASLDVVVAADVLEHVDDLTTVVDALGRTLRPGGALIVSGPTENLAYRMGRWVVGFSGDYHMRSVFDIEAELQRARFARERLRRLPLRAAPTLFRITLWRKGD
jgi:predicted TPR repeat methyltransferase